MRRPSLQFLLLASLAPLAGALIAADGVPAPDCAKCSDIPKIERELAEQKVARDAFREFTYDAQSANGRRQAASIKALQAAHAQLFSQMMGGGKPGKGKGGKVVAQAALETDLNDCKIFEVLPDGRKIALDESKYRKKLCLFADFLIEHEKNHVKKCERAHKEGLASEFENPIVVAELEVKGYQAGIDLLEAQLASLKASCFVSASGPNPVPDQAFASAADTPALQRESQRIAQALRRGWS